MTSPAVEPGISHVLSVPGSKVHLTAADLARTSGAPDWFPSEHTKMPAVVAARRSDGKIACGYCHLPDGNGRPENAKIAGLSSAYIIAQVRAIRTPERQPAIPGWAPSALMKDAIADLTDQDITAAAEYFSHQKTKSFVKVVEREYVPQHEASCGAFIPAQGPFTALRQTILEMPTDVERFERRDPHTAYIAYVPKGSIERGRRLADTGGNGRTQPCMGCHGADLRSGPELEGPPLAGRFASYLFRQLYGFKSGARGGDAAQPMQPVVANLMQADMIDLAAYAASLSP
jgi:cytochrome c553